MQAEQDRVRELLKIKDPAERMKALKTYAKKSKNDFSDEPETEVLNLAMMQPKLVDPPKPKPKPKPPVQLIPEKSQNRNLCA